MPRNHEKEYPAIGVFGFPKSGNTWVGNAFLELGRLSNPGFNSSFDIHVCLRKKERLQPNPAMKQGEEEFICFKSHAAKQYNKSFITPRIKSIGIGQLDKVIVLTRNPFDVLLSFINYSQFEAASQLKNQSKISKELEEFITDYVGFPRSDIEK